jgi:hypothetical protein
MLLLELYRKGADVEHEQFFTKPAVAAEVSQVIKSQPWFKDLKAFIEPSAGGGVFLKHFPNAVGYDLVPQNDSIKQADFLKHDFKTDPSKTLIFGNPPFGIGGSLALAFIKKAATLADTIAFILPATFAKASMKNKLPKNFHLEYEMKLPKDAFHSPAGKNLNVSCVFQIWRRGDTERAEEKFDASKSPLQFVTRAEADFAIRKIGDKTLGKLVPLEDVKTDTSFFFIKGDAKKIGAALAKCDFSQIPGAAAKGLRSISKLELTSELNKHL